VNRGLLVSVLGALLVLSGCAGITSGYVTGKSYAPAYDYQCQTGSIPINMGSGQVYVMPVYGTCTEPECYGIGFSKLVYDADEKTREEQTNSACIPADQWNRLNVGDWYGDPKEQT